MAVLRGQRPVPGPGHLGFVDNQGADHGQSREDTPGNEHQVQVQGCRKEGPGQKGATNTAAWMQTSEVLTWARAALCCPPQTKRTLGNEVPGSLGFSLSLPTERVDASTRASGVGVARFAHHDLTADVHLRGGDANAGQTSALQTLPAL